MSFGQRNYDRTRPEIDFPGDTPPEELVIEDLIEGSGHAVEPGDQCRDGRAVQLIEIAQLARGRRQGRPTRSGRHLRRG